MSLKDLWKKFARRGQKSSEAPKEKGPLTWEQVFQRKDLVGGEIEVHELTTVSRGPIQALTYDGDQVHFTLKWAARMPNPNSSSSKAGWAYDGEGQYQNMNARDYPPKDIGGGKILYGSPRIGLTFIIIPKGGSKIDRSLVACLPAHFLTDEEPVIPPKSK